jgi:DNA-binding transcriptional MerR regulator
MTLRSNATAATLTIGQLASLVEVSTDTLRYYEREKLLAPAAKSPSGYRLYDNDSIRRIRFIRQAQQCGFTLAEIGALLRLRNQSSARCSDVRKAAVEKQRQLDGKIRAMKAMSKALDALIADCAQPHRPLDACPIISALDRVNGTKRRDG